MQTQVLGISVDSVDCLRAWAESLGGISYPLLSDFWPHGRVAQMYGVLRPEGYSERALFVIDKTGVIRYVDVHDIDKQPDNEVLFRVLAEVSGQPVPPPVEPPPPAAQQTAQQAPQSEASIIMYCTPWCPACRRARAFFQQYNLVWQEIDITRDRSAAQRVRSWANGNETTPTFEINGQVVVDFNRARLMELLGIRE